MNIRQFVKDNVLIMDGGMGTMLMGYDLDLERDFLGKENCSEVLCETRPEVIREIHEAYLKAGAHAVETNSFGSSRIVFDEFGLSGREREFNVMAARIAREACEKYATPDMPRFVIGSMGPGTKLPTLGHTTYDILEASYHEQAAGLIEGGVDALLVETAQDLLQMKAAINGCKRAMDDAGLKGDDRPLLMAQATFETTGTMLVGTEIAAAVNALEALGVDVIGLNCATGPREMAPHIEYLSRHTTCMISVLPNAGLPELVNGKTHYPLSPDELADWHRRFVEEDGVNIVGGCCGTTPPHIEATARRIGQRAPTPRTPEPQAGVSSIYRYVPYAQENAVFAVGERTNANGSRAFRDMLAAEDWDGITRLGVDQSREGSHAVDVCVAYVGRPEASDMDQVMRRFVSGVDAPLMIDSTETEVIETALKRAGAKCMINSINFEDGEERPARVLELARRFGASVVALTIDEDGMAKTAAKKLEIARRLRDFACGTHGLPESDLIIDPLTFTICTGVEDDRELGIETLNGIRAIHEALPTIQIMLGLSNISFGLKPRPRQLLNSVFLAECQQAGMNMAILHTAKILPLFKIDEARQKIALDLIHNRRTDGYDPLMELMALFPEGEVVEAEVDTAPKTVEERLHLRIVDGNRNGLDVDIDEALATHPPLHIINEILLGGMKVVGELFGSGKMQLPFVLQSAETMKAAVALLEPHMDRAEGSAKGTLVLATVKGDVHDIGKNLVDIILTNNGYRVINLGIKQPADAVLAAVQEHQPDAIGLSGLLVKSTVIMREDLERFAAEGVTTPVLLGGAALTRKYVEEDCRTAYPGGRVDYARDAFDGLHLMDSIMSGEAPAQAKSDKTDVSPPVADRESVVHTLADELEERFRDAPAAPGHSGVAWQGAELPEPPFWGPRVLDSIPLQNIAPFINETMLYQFQWGFKKKSVPEEYAGRFDEFVKEKVRPIYHDLLRRCAQEKILEPRAVYGYWPCNSDGNDLVLYVPESSAELARFALPRQSAKKGGLCLADFFRPVSSGVRDVVGLQLVTMGQKAADLAREWFAQDRYQDYLYLHGLTVEMAEALAEVVHQRVRAEMGFAADDARDTHKLIHQGYRGARYSFGYPACPNLGDQKLLLELLNGSAIGVEMSEGDQLHPEASTSAVVTLHPQARYFGI
ncbi:MAG: methionine synthase [Nitrospirota bacterium]|nr:methionine synthase [Nitrospirota bacterium]